MQIGAGWAKGMRCEAPHGDKTRPTGAKVRAAVLNMVQGVVENARVLDLFAGSGAVGLEALSRGAASCVFVDKAPAALGSLRKNIAELERRATAQSLPVPAVTVIGADADVALERLVGSVKAKDEGLFELVYLDPPYRDAETWLAQLGPRLAVVCGGGAWLVVETAVESGELTPAPANTWVLVKRKTYGDTMITIWERR